MTHEELEAFARELALQMVQRGEGECRMNEHWLANNRIQAHINAMRIEQDWARMWNDFVDAVAIMAFVGLLWLAVGKDAPIQGKHFTAACTLAFGVRIIGYVAVTYRSHKRWKKMLVEFPAPSLDAPKGPT